MDPGQDESDKLIGKVEKEVKKHYSKAKKDGSLFSLVCVIIAVKQCLSLRSKSKEITRFIKPQNLIPPQVFTKQCFIPFIVHSTILPTLGRGSSVRWLRDLSFCIRCPGYKPQLHYLPMESL